VNTNLIDEAIVLKAPSSHSFQRRGDQDSEIETLSSNEAAIAGGPLDFSADALLVDWLPTSLSGIHASGAPAPSGAADAAPASPLIYTAPAVTIAEGASVEIAGVSAQSVIFTGTTGTLELDISLAFTGKVAGLAGSDTIDLGDVNYGVQTQVTYLGDTSGGTLTITDGVNTANIALQGNYLSSTWTIASDGSGGTELAPVV